MLYDLLLTGVAGEGRQATVTRRTWRTFNSPLTAIGYLGAHGLNIRHTPQGQTFTPEQGAEEYFHHKDKVGTTTMRMGEGVPMWLAGLTAMKHHFKPNMKSTT